MKKLAFLLIYISLMIQTIFFDECVYFETDDYFLLDGISNVRYYDSKYYCLADSIDIYKLVEFGRFIYGDEVNKMLEDSFCV